MLERMEGRHRLAGQLTHGKQVRSTFHLKQAAAEESPALPRFEDGR
jgi:hypothetical protein